MSLGAGGSVELLRELEMLVLVLLPLKLMPLKLLPLKLLPLKLFFLVLLPLVLSCDVGGGMELFSSVSGRIQEASNVRRVWGLALLKRKSLLTNVELSQHKAHLSQVESRQNQFYLF